MKLVDANVLLYAVNTDSRHHARSVAWLDAALSGAATVGFSWMVLLAFVRLATKTGLFPRPLDVDGALRRVERWLDAGTAVTLAPTPDHARIVRSLLEHVGTGGNLVNDAHLGALSIEHRGVVISYDNDFSRFPGVEWEEPPVLA